MYDPTTEAREFVGHDRAEALAKAAAFFGLAEDQLAVSEPEANQIFGLGMRVVLVAYPRKAAPPSRAGGSAATTTAGAEAVDATGSAAIGAAAAKEVAKAVAIVNAGAATSAASGQRSRPQRTQGPRSVRPPARSARSASS